MFACRNVIHRYNTFLARVVIKSRRWDRQSRFKGCAASKNPPNKKRPSANN